MVSGKYETSRSRGRKKATMRVHARPLATVWKRPRQTALRIDRDAQPARTRRRLTDKGPAGKCARGDGSGLVPRGYRRATCELGELLLHQVLRRCRARSDVEPRLRAPAFPERQRRCRRPNDAEPGRFVEDGGLARAAHPSSPGLRADLVGLDVFDEAPWTRYPPLRVLSADCGR